jgi:putative SOS response-associated peptidase YedK
VCGRFAFFSPHDTLIDAFGDIPGLEFSPRYNIAPSQDIAVVVSTDEQSPTATQYRWGLIPAWAKDPAIGNRMINARAETLAEKPSFRQAYSRRRCLILTNGFYEWQKLPEGKQPLFISRPDNRPFALAGLWDQWESSSGERVLSCTIVTTAANHFMQALHHRMPVCLEGVSLNTWLDSTAPREQLDTVILGPQPMALQAWPVSRRVNNPANDAEDLIGSVAS